MDALSVSDEVINDKHSVEDGGDGDGDGDRDRRLFWTEVCDGVCASREAVMSRCMKVLRWCKGHHEAHDALQALGMLLKDTLTTVPSPSPSPEALLGILLQARAFPKSTEHGDGDGDGASSVDAASMLRRTLEEVHAWFGDGSKDGMGLSFGICDKHTRHKLCREWFQAFVQTVSEMEMVSGTDDFTPTHRDDILRVLYEKEPNDVWNTASTFCLGKDHHHTTPSPSPSPSPLYHRSHIRPLEYGVQ